MVSQAHEVDSDLKVLQIFRIYVDTCRTVLVTFGVLLALNSFFWLQSEVTRRREEMEAMKAAELEALEGPLQRHEISHDDHPLSLGSKSVWHQFFQVYTLTLFTIVDSAFLYQLAMHRPLGSDCLCFFRI